MQRTVELWPDFGLHRSLQLLPDFQQSRALPTKVLFPACKLNRGRMRKIYGIPLEELQAISSTFPPSKRQISGL